MTLRIVRSTCDDFRETRVTRRKMPLLDKCFCCSLAIAAGFFAVYLLIGYLIAFAFELLWILESDVILPTSAVLLCAGYFTMALFAALLIHGLATKNTPCLIAWMFSVTILTFPEAGMVIYMSIQYWRIESLYGMTELACWLVRIIANVLEIIMVQSLYAAWKDEELVIKRLGELNMTSIPIPRDSSLTSRSFQNNAYAASIEDFAVEMKRSNSTPILWNGSIPNNITAIPYDTGMQFLTTQSEFNASIFVPNHFISNSDMQQLVPPSSAKKAQSMVDLRAFDEKSIVGNKIRQQQAGQPWMSQSIPEVNGSMTNLPAYTCSLDRRMNQRNLIKHSSLDDLNVNVNGHIIKNRTGFYGQPIEDYGVPIYYGPLHGPDFLIYKKKVSKQYGSSKNSLSNASDDVGKYRDVAL